MSDYYLFRKYGVCAVSQKKTLSRKKYFKAMTSSKMYRIFVILAILMTSSSDDVINFQILSFAICLPSCVELLWKILVSTISNSKVMTIYILNVFPFSANFEDLGSIILLWKIQENIFHIHIRLKFSQDIWD